jgi:quercetin dioxygenase-like cupin family protein
MRALSSLTIWTGGGTSPGSSRHVLARRRLRRHRAMGLTMKPRLVGSVVVAAALLAGGILPARGVPDSGWTVTELARSTISKPIAVEASGPTGVVMHHVVWQPGGINGWHTHPGPVFVQVKSGTFTLYTSGDGHCTRTDYPAGQGFVEHPGAVHVGRNESPEPFEVYVTWVGLPAGAPLFKAEPNPTGAGCPTLNPATERISRTELVQATTTEPVTIRQDGPSGIVMQQIQAAPGSGSGWRRQVGAAVFAVRSGAVVVTRVDHAGVATRTYRAGDAFVVAPGEVYRPCNEASEPAELYVTFLGLRRGQRS